MEKQLKNIVLHGSEKIKENEASKSIIAKYEDKSNKVEAIIDQKFKIINNIKDKNKLNEENFIDLDELERTTKGSCFGTSK